MKDGAQNYQEKVSKWKDNQEMFGTVNKIVMLHMDKGNQFDQVGVAEGIKRHGNQAITAVMKEYQQLKDMDTVLPISSRVLSYHQKKEALDLITS